MAATPSQNRSTTPQTRLAFAAFDDRSWHVGRRITVEPLVAEHYQEGGEEGSSKAGEEDCFDVDHRVGWAGPLWEDGNVVSEGGIVDLVNQDAEESCSLVAWVRLQLRVDLNDERGRDGGKETSLAPQLEIAQQNLKWDSRRSEWCSNPLRIS